MFGNEKTVRVTIQQDGTTVTLKKGNLLEVTLPATLGTGYSWQVTQAGEVLLSLRHQSDGKKRNGEGPKTGGAENQVFQFDAKSRGTGKLELQYVRPWEKQAPPAKTFSLTVTVQ
jgi:inhibitor of cysteine peptidase